MTDEKNSRDKNVSDNPTDSDAAKDEAAAASNKKAEKKKRELAELEAAIDGDASVSAGASALLSKPQPWAPEEYEAGGVIGHSARKLSSSFVAPLVAAARGYQTFDEDSVGEVSRAFRVVDKRTKQHRRLVEATVRSDVLMMPWYSASRLGDHQDGSNHDADSIQFRPGIMEPLAEGEKKGRKYESMANDQTPLGVHPSFPLEWLSSAPTILIAEGLLKGDAALTGMLLDAGITREELSYNGEPNPRAVLRGLIEKVPADKHVIIYTLVGVWNWRSNPEWSSVSMKGREVWVGIDGDVATNPLVYKAADALWKFCVVNKHASKVQLLTPVVPREPSASTPEGIDEEKLGIDDYLAAYGTWSTLLDFLSDSLPPAPADLRAAHGDVKVNTDGVTVSRYEITQRDPISNEPVAGAWHVIYELGGRIVSTLAERVPSNKEISTGEFGLDVPDTGAEWEVEIEVSFLNEAGEVEQHIITGPNRILNYLPEQWDSKGAKIPGPVFNHESWPPRGKDAGDWVRAIKLNRKSEVVRRVRWATMGWVPVPGGIPAYIAGDQVIGGEDVEETDEVMPGITNDLLPGAENFGLGHDEGHTFDDPEYRAQVKDAIEAMLKTYVLDEPWRDRRNAAVIVAAGVRPALPIRPKCILYFTGARGTGKTFSAEAVMGFWQARPGSLFPLPGNAKDTAAAMELAVARANIWTIDDLAPATSRRQSDDEKDKIGNLIRAVFNGAAKARSNANMESRKKHNPRALLIVTAENEPTVSSERDRVVLCDIGYGALSRSSKPTTALSDMIDAGRGHNVGATMLVSQAVVKYLRYLASREGSSWRSVYEQVAEDLSTNIDYSLSVMEGSGSKRHAETAAHLLLSYTWLDRVAKEVNCDDWVIDLLARKGGLPADILQHIMYGVAQNKETSPGRALIESLSMMLRRGRAHILSSDDPTRPPLDPVSDSTRLQSLGWHPIPGTNGEWRPAPGTDSIGWLFRQGEDQVVLFDPKVAFSLAKAHSDGLIPNGQGARSSWSAATGEGFGYRDLLREDGRTGRLLNTARKTSGGVERSGYPVRLEQVLIGGRLETESSGGFEDSDD